MTQFIGTVLYKTITLNKTIQITLLHKRYHGNSKNIIIPTFEKYCMKKGLINK